MSWIFRVWISLLMNLNCYFLFLVSDGNLLLVHFLENLNLESNWGFSQLLSRTSRGFYRWTSSITISLLIHILVCRFWTHLVMAYAFTFWTCYVLKREYEIVASMRLHFLASEQRRPDQFTVSTYPKVIYEAKFPLFEFYVPQAIIEFIMDIIFSFSLVQKNWDLLCYNVLNRFFLSAGSNLVSDIILSVKVLVKNVPPDPDESVCELVEHFFLVNHPEHYLSHQVWY